MPRLFIGNLRYDVNRRDIEHEFSRFGRVDNIDIKRGFAFLDFSSRRDAEDAIDDMHKRDFDGRRITVEYANGGEGSSSGGGARDRRDGGRKPNKPQTDFRVVVEGLDDRTSWQDLKDFGRKAGEPIYTDVWSERGRKMGLIEFRYREDMDKALRVLDDEKLDGVRVRVRKEKRSRSRSASRGHSRSRSGSRKASRSRSRSRSNSARQEASPAAKSRSRSNSRHSRSGSRSHSADRDRDEAPANDERQSDDRRDESSDREDRDDDRRDDDGNRSDGSN